MDERIFGAIGVAVSAAFVWVIIRGHRRGPRPRRSFAWDTPPRLRFADGVDPITRAACRAAWAWLARHGATLGAIETGGSPSPTDGEIVVVPIDEWAHPDHAGRAVTRVNEETRRAVFAVVELPLHTEPQAALHEFLHALGFVQHVDMTGHVLSSATERLGNDRRGIEEALRSTTL